MNIGIDIDGVLTNMEREMTDFATRFCVEQGWPIKIKLGEYAESKAFSWSKEQVEKFWNKYWIKYLKETQAKQFASEVIKRLQEEGNKIYLITARDETGIPPEYCGKIQALTREWLQSQNIEYEKIIFTKDKEKLQHCLENNINVMIEDSPSNIEYISKKIKVIKFDCQYNRKVNGENIITAYSWYHIYRIIKEMEGN